MTKIKRFFALLLVATLCFSISACDSEDLDGVLDELAEQTQEAAHPFDPDNRESIGTSGDPDQTWAIYWYLCGSDLESEYGAASTDIAEILDVDLPENVQMVIQTGGAWKWENDMIDPSMTERYLYSSDGIELVDQQPLSNMGDPETLADFLFFCEENYPADRTMVVFWNHGGGSVSGASFDEVFDYDQLTLSEFYQAFDAVYDLSVDHPPVDVVGFDACLMATIDTAYVFCDVAKYLVASEELEPGYGWYYTGWLQELADDPGMDGARLGKVICDTYYDENEWNDLEDETTLSVVDLSRFGPLMEAYENMGTEALAYALEDPGFFSLLGREADRTENYGGNSWYQGYTNMLDLGHLARNCEDLLPETSQEVQDCLADCVIYQVKGDYRQNASGLSCYYSYNGDVDDFYGYLMEGCSESFKYLYDYSIVGDMSDEGMEFISSIGYEEEELPYIPNLEEDGEEEYPLYIDDEDYVTLELDPDIVNMLKGVYFTLAYVDYDEDIMLMLGKDNDLFADWDSGIFQDNFRGVWGCIDENLVYMEVSYESDDYTVYAVPILLNGEEYNLRVSYDYNDEQFYILGARKGLDDNGMADKNLIQLQPGDEITTIHYAATISGDDDFQAIPMDTFTVTEDTSFYETDMGDGTYLMMFELLDAKNNIAYSEAVQFIVEGNYMDIEILD